MTPPPDERRRRRRPRHRPPWWPENEPFPPRGGRWRRPPYRVIAWFWAGALVFVAAVASVAALAVWASQAALGWAGHGPVRPPGGPVALLVIAVVILVVTGARGAGRLGSTVGALTDAAARVEGGDYSARVEEPNQRDLRRVVRAFNAMSARLEETDSARRTFLAEVAHELRTPLSVIRGQAEGIADGVYPADADHLAPILDATRTLEHLVDDLRTLTLAQTGTLELHREPVDIPALAADTVTALTPAAQEAGVELTVKVDPATGTVDADPVRLRSVLHNLVANALAHTPRGGRVEVGGRAAGREVEIEVDDTGPGFSPDLLPHVFDRFVKGAGSTGSGLGLAIARDLVEAHGGRIEASNRAAGGARVRLTIPRQ